MKTKLLLIAALAVTVAAQAVPAVKILTPKRNGRLTNGVATATGTVKSTLPIAGVYYSFNGGAWSAAAGTTNWSVPDLALTAGLNTLSVYAADSGGVSPTNTVTFTYVVMLPISVLVNGQGMVNPDYNVRLLEIGRKYVMNAKAAKGFGFTGWTRNGDPIPDPAHMFFIMASNLTFTANFSDTARPLCVVTYPAVKQSVSNSPITAICRASDNVGVTAVHYKLNGDAWDSDATSSDGTTWNVAGLSLVPGTNTLRAFAEDAVGNLSMTNTVVFTYVSNAPPVTGFAPASIAGMRGVVEGAMGESVVKPPFEISFGMATYASTGTNIEDEPEAGNYFYTVLDPNTFRLTTYSVTPVDEIFYELKSHIFVFTNSTTAIFTNWDDSIGTITFSPISNLVPLPSTILTVSYWDVANPAASNVSVLDGGNFTNYANYGTEFQAATSWGTYSFMQFSPVVAMMRQNFTNPDDAGTTSYVLLTFDTATSGSGFVESFDTSTNLTGIGLAGFALLSSANPPSGNAPMSIAGKLVTVSQVGTSIFKVCFGENTYSVFDANTNDDNANLEDYCYIKTGPNTGKLIQKLVFPPNDSDLASEDSVILTFNSATSGTATTSHGTDNLSISTANDWAPTSLAGRTIINSQHGTGTFNDNGTFTYTSSGGSQTGNYDYAKFSPMGGLIIISWPDGSLSYTQIQMVSATGGQWYQTDFNNIGMVTDISSGSFRFY